MKTTDRPTDLTRITLTSKDGAEQILEIDDDLHYILGFVKCGPHGGKSVPAEVLVKGNADIVGEIFFRIGDQHHELLDICARRVMEKTRARLKARGIDPEEDAFKRARPVGGVQ